MIVERATNLVVTQFEIGRIRYVSAQVRESASLFNNPEGLAD
jgi:hypothetical protein